MLPAVLSLLAANDSDFDFSQRQVKLRQLCFGKAYEHYSVSHSFGVDLTHNLCCDLGPEAKRYADASGNPIGSAAEKIDVIGDKTFSRWSTCMGSNVCSVYASKFDDGTRPLFASSPDLTRIVTDLPGDPDCEAYAAQVLNMGPHGTPGIYTRGDPKSCRHKRRVDNSLLVENHDIDQWLVSAAFTYAQ